MATIVSDSFNRANGALGTADTGQTWTDVIAGITVVSNTASGTGHTYVDSLVADRYDLSATFTTLPASADCYIGFRFISNTSRWRYGFNFSGQHYVLQKTSPTTNMWIGYNTPAPANGDILKVRVMGDDISLYLNGTYITTITDSFSNTGTSVGFHSGASSVWDNLLMTDVPNDPIPSRISGTV